MGACEIFSPAKINLFLAVTGRRADGFHELVSVAAPTEFGDTLRAEGGENFSLECDDAAVPVDGTNLVLRAAEAFRAASGWRGGAKFFLTKRIPMGAGLGGGSSNAVAALRALNALAGGPLDGAALHGIAVQLGSDCAMFLHGGPVVMRGRGERVEPLMAGAAGKIRGRRVLIFKPGFGIATPWVYARLAAGAPASYRAAAEAEALLAAWSSEAAAPAEAMLGNNLEPVAFAKFIALPALLAELRTRFGLLARLSGSGSACFALLPEGAAAGRAEEVTATIRAAWGEGSFVTETRLT